MKPDYQIVRASSKDLSQMMIIYNHYIQNTPISFDTESYSLQQAKAWFSQFNTHSPYQCFVLIEGDKRVLGYACSKPFSPKGGYLQSLELSVYLDANCLGHGFGSALYLRLFEEIKTYSVHRCYAGITLPNQSSIKLHQKFGFKQVGLYSQVGYKFNQYWDVAWFEKALV